MSKDIKNRSGGNDNRTVFLGQSLEHHGPLPLPSDFAAYEKVLPGSAERIFAMAEREQGINHFAIKAAIAHEGRTHTTARWIAFFGLGGGFVLAIIKGDLFSYCLLTAELGSLVGSFIYSRVKTKQ